MTGKRYYLTTLGAWRRHASRSVETHFVFLEEPQRQGIAAFADATEGPLATRNEAAPVLVLVSADEVAHIALENDSEVEALPHPLARTLISERAAAALAHFGVTVGDDTFTVAEKLARVNPLLRHRVF
ncbi:MAG TPA: hypothetical protein VJN90_05515 [Candidatus Acidoferrales bacterium]|nr:hypothetical protein [Candidatus Acidoferrales bacterium]